MKRVINLDDFFDQIYCINLKSRPDRLISFKKNLKALGTSNITYFEAINGRTLDINGWHHSAGALGCRLSHISIYKEAIKNNYSKILVLEDDAIISTDFLKSLYKIIDTVNDDWDLIYFGGAHFATPDKINDNVIRLKATTALHSVAINCRCLPQILTTLEQNNNQVIDVVLADMQPKLKAYSPTKPTARQIRGYSDIEETHVDYNVSLMSKIWHKLKRNWDGLFNR
jgi:GR25 family glycosyltransferase involved in LPS biosynthesis